MPVSNASGLLTPSVSRQARDPEPPQALFSLKAPSQQNAVVLPKKSLQTLIIKPATLDNPSPKPTDFVGKQIYSLGKGFVTDQIRKFNEQNSFTREKIDPQGYQVSERPDQSVPDLPKPFGFYGGSGDAVPDSQRRFGPTKTGFQDGGVVAAVNLTKGTHPVRVIVEGNQQNGLAASVILPKIGPVTPSLSMKAAFKAPVIGDIGSQSQPPTLRFQAPLGANPIHNSQNGSFANNLTLTLNPKEATLSANFANLQLGAKNTSDGRKQYTGLLGNASVSTDPTTKPDGTVGTGVNLSVVQTTLRPQTNGTQSEKTCGANLAIQPSGVQVFGSCEFKF